MKTNYTIRYNQAKKEFSNASTPEDIKRTFENLKRAYNNLKAVKVIK